MQARSFRLWPLPVILAAGLAVLPALHGQDAAPADDAPPPVPKGVEVLARGPVHEAFATLTAEPQPTTVVPKKPPQPLQEMPPDEKPEGDAIWISGYWAWDDDRSDFLWVSGIWRTPPPGKQYVAGYWRDEGDGAQWVPGFWQPVPANEDAPQDVTYLPQPPAPPKIAPPGAPPSAETFYVPGHWEWNGADYLWRGGYWAKVQPGYVWITGHYRWTPGGYIYIAGYWDYSVKRRGVLYAPVVVDANVVEAGFVYTPAYAVQDTVVVDALFVRPSTCHYYFGDYYDVSYHDAGYTSCVVYSRDNYDSIIVYERYEHRDEPNWVGVQVDLFNDRRAGRAPVPPRTLNQQINVVNNTTIVNNVTNVTNVNNVNNNVTVNKQVMNTTVLAAPSKVMAANGAKVVKLDSDTRQLAKQQSVAVQQVAVQRTKAEVPVVGAPPKQAHVASLNVPPAHPVAPKMTVAPTITPASGVQTAPTTLAPGKPAHPAMPATQTQAPVTTPATAPNTATTTSHVNPLAPPPGPAVTPAVTTPAKPGPLVTPATTPIPTPPKPAVTAPPGPPVHPPTSPPPPPPAKKPTQPPPKDKDHDKDHQPQQP